VDRRRRTHLRQERVWVQRYRRNQLVQWSPVGIACAQTLNTVRPEHRRKAPLFRIRPLEGDSDDVAFQAVAVTRSNNLQ